MLQISLQLVGFRLPPLFLDTDDWEGKGGMNELHPYSFAEKCFYQFQEKWLMRRVAGVTVASRALQSMVSEMGVAPDRVCYLPNGVARASEGNRHSTRERLKIRGDEPVLLLYTRFFEFGQERLHRVFSEIFHHVPHVRILVVGKGRNDEEKKLVEAARYGGYADSLTMAGWVEPAEIPDYLAAADVAIYPLDDTLVNRCKCPAKLTELLAAGVPVVADGVGQAIEYIDGRESDLLCNPEDCSEMAEKTIRLLLNPKRRRILADRARRYLLENFSWREGAAMLDNFYRSM
jgi:glycosyltransferase involved in cell wall biosynthesis